ncbi:MAG TPA: ShlB/FhaC/HecB family hemolysin secretion/activation protein, partial [Thermoleophilia bacterium]|nr:ShlB/FhaC/HecB family hemolysin secretion/activation protein [Thermoleophilia bacterium]
VEPSRAGPTLRVFVREIRVTGNTVFSDAELAQVSAPYTGREITDEDLAALRQALTLKYVNAGYINSGAVISDQRVVNGVIEYRIIEGTLAEVTVTGTKRLRADYVSDRLALGAAPPLNAIKLQEQLQILLQGPFVERINAELSPGDRQGEARLSARVEEGPAGNIAVTVDNDLSPALGDVRVVLRGQLYNPSGRGDILTGEIEHAQGYTKLFADYGIPLNARDTTFDVFAEWTDADVVEKPLNVLDIQSQSSTVGFRVSHPLFRTTREQFNLAAGFDLRQSKSKLLGEGFAFTPGVEPDGQSKVSVLRFIQDYVARTSSQVIAARSTFSWGIDAFGATNEGNDLPNGEFLAWLGQFQYARRLGKSGSQLVFRFDGQLSSDPLLPLEQFSVCGLRTVRGYRRNQLVRDQGYATSLELRVPVLRHEDNTPLLQVSTFVDAGGAWYKGRATEQPQTIKSAGFGLRFNPHRRVEAELYWAKAFDDGKIINPSESLQDRGWHFVIRADLL